MRSSGGARPAAAELAADTGWAEAELVELESISPRGGAGPMRTLFGIGVLALVALIAFAGLPGDPPETTADASAAPRGSSGPFAAVTAPPVTPGPWAWSSIELRGFGRGAGVENLWALGDVFVAEIENDLGPDGGPFGPITSVLLTSTDGLEWSRAALPADEFSVETGTVADGRLWILGYTGVVTAPHWEMWSTDDGEWRHEGDPVGLVDGPARVTALAYQGACEPDGDCGAVGWVAAVAPTGSARDDQLRVSVDARTWVAIDLPDVSALSIVGVAFHRGRWVVAAIPAPAGPGQGTTIALTSHDRVRWTSSVVSALAGGGRDLGSGVGGLALVGVEVAEGRRLPRIWLSSDGVGWLRLRAGMAPGRTPVSMDHVTSTDHGYMALQGSSGDAWISTDGEFWCNLPAFVAGPADAVRAVAAAGDVLLAAGRSTAGRPTFWAGSLSVQLSSQAASCVQI